MPYTVIDAGIPACIANTYYRIHVPGSHSSGSGCETLARAHDRARAESETREYTEVLVEEWVYLTPLSGCRSRHESRIIAAYVHGEHANVTPAEYAQDREAAEARAFGALREAEAAERALRWSSCGHAAVASAADATRRARAAWHAARFTAGRARKRAAENHGPRPTYATEAEARAAAAA